MSGTHRETHLEARVSTWKTTMAFKFNRFSSREFCYAGLNGLEAATPQVVLLSSAKISVPS